MADIWAQSSFKLNDVSKVVPLERSGESKIDKGEMQPGKLILLMRQEAVRSACSGVFAHTLTHPCMSQLICQKGVSFKDAKPNGVSRIEYALVTSAKYYNEIWCVKVMGVGGVPKATREHWALLEAKGYFKGLYFNPHLVHHETSHENISTAIGEKGWPARVGCPP